MKDYFEFSQLLHWLSEEALAIMLETEADSFRASIITNEIEARHAMHRARLELGMSYKLIGRVLGGRDHTTIMYGVRRYETYRNRGNLDCRPD
jgi:chromosomal replication initiation ATPase DnaA